MANHGIKIVVHDRETVERGFVMREPYILISIRDPDKKPVRYRRTPLCQAVLELAFHDAEPTAGFTPSRPLIYMTEADAEAVWRFVRQHEGAYGAIAVHCEQGMSRSPAVAAGIAEGMGLDSETFWSNYQPNQFVYGRVQDAAGG
jgi:predicted protein tyrosine phosphatase